MGVFTRSRKSRAAHPGLIDDWGFMSPSKYKEATVSNYASNQSSFPDRVNGPTELQVEAIGYSTNQALCGYKTLENISVYSVDPRAPMQQKYISMRPKRNSNSCALVQSSDPSQSALISTIYRWGPGRNPRMRILPRNSKFSVEQALDGDHLSGELIDVQSRSMINRAQVFNTSLGNFEWRYGRKEERKALKADSLLICERIDCAALAEGTETKSGTRVAQLIRNDQLRTPGSVRYSGGNGGRLMMDLREWKREKNDNAGDAEAFFVASCIVMLKREADRFINNNLAAVV